MSNTLTTEKSGSVRRSSRFTDYDIYLLKQGNHTRLYEKFGAREGTVDGVDGSYFAVWAPNAREVAVIGDFNNWDPNAHRLYAGDQGAGIWEGFIPGVRRGAGASVKAVLITFHLGRAACLPLAGMTS